MKLEEFEKKRTFKGTKKLNEKIIPREEGIYVIQKHYATHLHYDLRLEMDGVLKSWALPKEPYIKLGVRRLAIQVEDHSVDYAEFKGSIPKGDYGAGTVEIWDKGTYKLIDKKEKKLIINIKGKKLKDTYALVKFKEPKNWLFFKKKNTR